MNVIDNGPCPSCGARLGGRSGCQAAFDALSAQAWGDVSRGAVHNLLVDTYSLQHPEEYCASPKSYAAHLTGLCCWIDHPGDSKLYWSIAKWLDGPAALDRPPFLTVRGSVTIADIQTPRREHEYAELAARWARDVWAAYAAQHDLARRWLNAVRVHVNQPSARVPR